MRPRENRFDIRPGIRRFFRLPLRTARSIHADADEELESLIAARVDDYILHGMSPRDARDEALRRLGVSIDVARHQLHHSAELRERRMRIRDYLGDLSQDLRYAARGLLRRPGFTTVVVLTLAIGIGATTSLFSSVNVLLLRHLPFERPDELMRVSLIVPPHGDRPGMPDMVWSYPKYVAFRDAQTVFAERSLYAGDQFTITGGDVEQIRGEWVGASYLRTLGLHTSAGRDFDPSVDAEAGGVRQILISQRLWDRRFNDDPAAIGRTLEIDRTPYTIIGVAPRGFVGLTGQAEVFVPITARTPEDLSEPLSHEFTLVARRNPNVSIDQAQAQVALLGTRISAQYQDRVFPGLQWGARAEPLDAIRVSPLVRRSLLTLFAAVALVLLIACVNVANLLLGRAAARRREIAVRLAVGAGRGRIARLLVTESVLLALAGGVASIAVAWLGVHLLASMNPLTAASTANGAGLGAVVLSPVTLDWTALAFLTGLSVAVGLIFGLVPAIGATRPSLTDALKNQGATTGRARGATTGRRLLVVAEVALALVLLAGSGLMVRSLSKLLAIDPGFDAHNVLTVRLTIPPGGLARDSMPGFYTEMLAQLRALPGVTHVGLNNCPPLNGGCAGTNLRRLDQPNVDMAHGSAIGVHWASPDWFATLGIPLKAGRFFSDADRAGAPQVVLVNETAARRIWPGESPLGKHVEIGQGGFDDAEVVGVVGGVRQNPDSLPGADVYLPLAQSPRPAMMIFIKSNRPAEAIAGEVRAVLHTVAPRDPAYDVQTLAHRIAGATGQARFSAMLLAFFGMTALSLAVVGIYGVISLGVAARAREIGIRMALGAETGRVQRLVVREGLSLVAVGAVIGLIGALAATRMLRTLLYDLSPSDPVTYAGVLVVLGACALAASWIPARRAARVDPVNALRSD